MIRKQIYSVKDESDPRPWYEIDLSNAPPEITDDSDGGINHDATSATVEAIGSVDADNPSKDCVYAVTTDGRYICYPQGRNLAKDGISLRAHLAWFDADADEFTVLEFVQG